MPTVWTGSARSWNAWVLVRRPSPEMVKVMYADVASELHEPAARSVLAHLIAMTADGRVGTDAEPTAEAVYYRG